MKPIRRLGLYDTIYHHMDSTRIKRNYGVFKGQHENLYDLDILIKE